MLDSNLTALDGYSGLDRPGKQSRDSVPLVRRSRISPASSGDSPDEGGSSSPIDSLLWDRISKGAIRDQLGRIITSSMFVQSERLAQFLRFTVETTLEGDAESLKEYVIGTQVYGRKSSYQPTEDSIVRSEARRLRRKLQEFYQAGGKDDPVFIHYRPGSYVPVFKMRADGNAPTPEECRDAHAEGHELRVAVLPFLDLSNGAMSGACAQCLTDELIHQLVRTDGVRVTATCAEKSGDVDIPSLVKKLDVQVVFEGTVGEDDSQLRVTARVVNSDGLRIWSERFETNRDCQYLLSISTKIASALISRIGPKQAGLRGQRTSGDAPALQINPLALRAEALIDEGTERAILSALAKWQEAIKIDPDDSTALCGLSQCYCEIALRGIPQSSAAISHANQAAERASQLDSDLPIVLACRGTGYALSWNWREAETCFKQALEFGDNPGMYRQYAVCLAGLGRFREAWAFIQKAQQIDPFSYRQKVIYTRLLYLSRNYENGMRYLSEQLLYGRLPNEAEVYRAMMLISHNRLDEARQIAKDLSEKSDAEACIMSGVAEILARCGDSPAATRIVDDYRLFTSVSPISRFRQALLLVGLRDPERAIVVLTEACEQRDAELIWLACDPRLDGIREDIRFKCLQDRVMCNCSSPFQG